MLSDVLSRTLGEFGTRLQAFAPKLLAVMATLAGTPANRPNMGPSM